MRSAEAAVRSHLPGMSMDVQQLLHRLNALVTDCIGKHLYASAVFYADKLMTLADNHPDTVHQLASVSPCSSDAQRCLHLYRILNS